MLTVCCLVVVSQLQSFAVDNATGSITVAEALDRETISAYILTVMALDSGTPPMR